VPGWIATSAIFLAFLSSIGALLDLLDHSRRSASSSTPHGPTPRPGNFKVGLDPGRPAVGVHVPRGQRRVVPDPPVLGRLHGGDRGYARYFAYLNFFVFSMLLLVLAATS
jgi:NADH-quinone oxidoreductase subunit L